MPLEWPLTSFASTAHNVASFSFLLGALWSLGLVLSARMLTGPHLLWSLDGNAQVLGRQGMWEAMREPQFGMYLSCCAVFHLLEFVVTSMWNPGKLTVGCTSPLPSLSFSWIRLMERWW
jgi:hypothetical protein